MHVSGYFPLAHRFLLLAGHYGQKFGNLKNFLPLYISKIFGKFQVLSEGYSPFQVSYQFSHASCGSNNQQLVPENQHPEKICYQL